MIPRRLKLLLILTVLGSFAAVGVTPASAATSWNLELHHEQTNFQPGGTGQYWVNVNNVGDTTSSGKITLTIDLPAGLTFESARRNHYQSTEFIAAWSCLGSAGGSVVTCTTESEIPRHTIAVGLFLNVAVDPLAAEGEALTTATLEGGGGAAVGDLEPIWIRALPASFGIVPHSFVGDFFDEDGLTPVRQAGAHPALATFAFDFNSVAAPILGVPDNKEPANFIRDLTIALPPGFVGYPSAVGECEPSALLGEKCPASSQVGVLEATVQPSDTGPTQTAAVYTAGVYNMVHPPGTVTDLAFQIANNVVHVKVGLDPANDYSVRSTVSNINETLPVFYQKMTLWGVPAEAGHDSQRCPGFAGETSTSCSTDAPPKPFLSVPSQCGVDQAMRLSHYDSWQHTGVYGPEVDYQLPGQTTNCDRPHFEPSLAVRATNQQANTPTGLEVRVRVPQNQNPNGLATPPVKSIAMTLPEGMALSPAAANGLASCGEAQIGLGTNDPVACPDASRIGTVALKTPVLQKELEGTVYLAAQRANPFRSIFAIYLAIHDTEERGVLVKLPGKIELDPATGQITTTFEELPQLPFEEVDVTLRSGNQAPLVNSPACGSEAVSAQVTSWAQPGNPVPLRSTVAVDQGPGGSPCPASVGARPFGPALSSGTVNPLAGAFSPFLFRVTRADADQDLSRIEATLPEGLLAKIAGVPYCPEAALASISTVEGTGAAELGSPACPSASRIGSVLAGVGSGLEPDYFPGTVFLAGPYKGAPLSLAIVVPAVAGPFDLGNVLVRAAVGVDPTTAQVKAVSDPFPTILYGVPLHQRDIRLELDRPETMLNPTSCDPMAVRGTALSTSGIGAPLASRFQVGGCGRLDFKPRLKLRLKGATRRIGHPALKAVLTARPGEADIGRAQVNLPHGEFLDQGNLNKTCTKPVLTAGNCPRSTVYGTAKAWTPLLEKPLQGNVYLVGGYGYKLPALVADLNGQIRITLVGKVDSGKNKGIRNTFEVVPDAPVSRFVLQMKGGRKYGLLENSENLCKAKKSRRRAIVRFTAQNGKVRQFKPVVTNQCRKAKKPKKRSHAEHRGGKKG